MIIQCGKCSAKFRFDDTLMREEGIWVRCALCKYEFFQCHPPASPDAEAPAEPDIRDAVQEHAALKKRRPSGALKIFAVVLVALLMMAGIGFLAFPDIGRQAMADLSSYLPWLEQEKPPSIEDGIRIEAIQQRFVVNVSAGNLRVVEGVAVNQSGHPVARLQVKATLMDTQGNRLGEKQAYAGHVLSDAELMVLTEEEINRRLITPEGSTASNDRIMPGGRIPFMIIWAFEPPGAAKTFVTVAGVERLLQ